MSNIKCFSLLNGMELIGKVKDETSELFSLENTLLFVLEANGVDRSLKLAPPSMFSNESNRDGMTLELYKTSIVFTYTPKDDIEKQYAELTNSLIVASAFK